MTEYTIKRGNMESVLIFRKPTKFMQPGNVISSLDWVWERAAPKVDKLRKIKPPRGG